MSYQQNSSRLRRLPDFFGITDSSGLIPLSQIRDNGMINNGKSASQKPSVVEQLKNQPSTPKKDAPSKKPKEEVR